MSAEDATEVTVGRDVAATIDLYRMAKAEVSQWSERAEELRERIEIALQESAPNEPERIDAYDEDENYLCSLSVVWSKRLDTAKLREQYPTVADQFSTVRPSVRLTLARRPE